MRSFLIITLGLLASVSAFAAPKKAAPAPAKPAVVQPAMPATDYSTPSYASSPSKGITLRPLLGLNFYSPSISPEVAGQTYSSKAGINIGALVDFGVTPMMSVETGIINNGNGYDIKNATGTGTLTFRSWEIPLTLQYAVADAFGLGGGLYYESFSGGTLEASGISVPFDWIKSSTFGLKFNARYNLALGGSPSGVFFDLAYKMGLSSRTATGSTSTYKDRAIAFSVGLDFDI